MGVCFYCQKEDGSIVLPGMMKGDREAPRKAVWSIEPCPACKQRAKEGEASYLVEATPEGPRGTPKPTGRFVLMKHEAIRRIFDERMAEATCAIGVAFIEPAAWRMIGLDQPQESAA